MAGLAAWYMASHYPDRWAAVAPICGAGELDQVHQIGQHAGLALSGRARRPGAARVVRDHGGCAGPGRGRCARDRPRGPGPRLLDAGLRRAGPVRLASLAHARIGDCNHRQSVEKPGFSGDRRSHKNPVSLSSYHQRAPACEPAREADASTARLGRHSSSAVTSQPKRKLDDSSSKKCDNRALA